ncbi:hypothetical protein J5N97_030083 [Dioscorea zingiberensis]|uniref:Uncharacterized protein n=1 Tax=Dioscorea zingiberensis TaxID=325984 RepID=A0A9D5BX07_9LILI|nr:hypothetical protein J5N97_030083 [Dioscorea zingiberensis]
MYAFPMALLSRIGTGITNALIKTRRALDENMAGESEDLPMLSTSVAYGVYMAVSSNLRSVAAAVPRSVPVLVAHELLQVGHRYLDVRYFDLLASRDLQVNGSFGGGTSRTDKIALPKSIVGSSTLLTSL